MSSTPSPRTDPELARFRSLRDAMLWLAGLVLLTYLSSALPLPWKPVTLVFAAAGLAWGVVALVRSTWVKSLWVLRLAPGAAMAGCLLFGSVAAAQVVFWDATEQFEECSTSALTDRALQNCTDDYAERMGTPR